MSFSHLAPPAPTDPDLPYEQLVEAASAAIPADFSRNPAEILVALDVDGTLLRSQGASPRVRECVAEALEAGVNLVIATGRGVSATRPVFAELGIESGYSVCSNGAITVHWDPRLERGRSLIHTETFDPEPAGRLMLEAFDGEILLGTDSPDEETLNVSAPFPPGEIITKERVLSVDTLLQRQTPKLVGRMPGMPLEEFDARLQALPFIGVEVTVGWTAWVDVGPGGCTKATGLQALTERLELPATSTVAIGDGTNDIAMLEWASLGVAMGVAPPSVLTSANHVTGSVEGDGSAAVLRAILNRL